MEEQWYSVRCIFKHQRRQDMTKRNLYEERITIWRAKSFEEAIEKAEIEANEYADPDAEYTGLAQAFNLFAETLQDGEKSSPSCMRATIPLKSISTFTSIMGLNAKGTLKMKNRHC